MAKKNRSPLQVDPRFKEKLDQIQKKIMMARGEKISFRDITADIISSPMFDEIEKSMIKTKDLKIDLKIRLDGRMLE